jgi:hypothetical protein
MNSIDSIKKVRKLPVGIKNITTDLNLLTVKVPVGLT